MKTEVATWLLVAFVMGVWVGYALEHRDPPEVTLDHDVVMFHGQECTQDCSGHIAGYRWASKRASKGGDSSCEGNSQSFTEGCEQYWAEDEERYYDDQTNGADPRQ